MLILNHLAKFMKIFFTILILMYTAALSYAQSSPNEIYSKGVEYFYRGEFHDAIKYFDDYIRSNPNEYSSFNYRGLCYQALKDYSKALEDFTTVVNLGRTNSEGFINRGNTFYLKDDYNSALNDYTEAIKYNPNDVEGYIARSRSYIALNKLTKALTDLNAASSVDPKNARVYVNLAYAHILNNDTSKAFDDVKTALFYDSNMVFTNYSRDLLYVKAETYKSVLDIMNYNIRQNPGSYLAYFSRGFVYYLMNNYENSRSDMLKSIELNEIDDPKFEDVAYQILRNIKRKT